ncbi:MAG: hypothetical protein JNJ77_15385 [Planctomycetia bacterium]|nr:hypothetical protein [Planctomycetia bacterium]
MPFWWTHGIGLIFFGFLFAVFLYQARYINGVPHDVIQPGAILGLCAYGGIAGTGFTVMMMVARADKTND